MFKAHSDSNALTAIGQQDILASAIRIGLGTAGPVGVIVGEFLTQFVPAQRMDRLRDFTEQLAERLSGIEEGFNDRLASSAAFAALAEQVSLSAVRTASSQHRRDLAHLLKHGLSRSDAEMIEEEDLLSLRNQLNEPQVLILMSYGNFKRTNNDPKLKAFRESHPGVFEVQPPCFGDPPEIQHRWTIYEHYKAGLVALGLIKEMEGVAKSGRSGSHEITHLGRMLLRSIGRFRSDD